MPRMTTGKTQRRNARAKKNREWIAAQILQSRTLQLIIGWILDRIPSSRGSSIATCSPETMAAIAAGKFARETGRHGTPASFQDHAAWVRHLTDLSGMPYAPGKTAITCLPDTVHERPTVAMAMARTLPALHAMHHSIRYGEDNARSLAEAIENSAHRDILNDAVILLNQKHPLGLFNISGFEDPRIRTIIRKARRTAHVRKHGWLLGRITPLPKPVKSGMTIKILIAATCKTWDNHPWILHKAPAGPNGNDASMALALNILHRTARGESGNLMENLDTEPAYVTGNNDQDAPWRSFLLENDQGVCALDIFRVASIRPNTGHGKHVSRF